MLAHMFSPFWWRFEYDTYYTSHKLAYMLRLPEVSSFHPSPGFRCISPYLGSDVMMLPQHVTCVSDFEQVFKAFQESVLMEAITSGWICF